ncbi:hypothetical protein [Streptomyces tsukubensis]|uniref:hypothetical protein n=1 Tax=Streptomyces tsukubensis TaxID=83656 RepID=UPI00344EE3FA
MIADEVRTELERLGVTGIAPGLAAMAVSLAQSLDSIAIGDAPTSRAVVARELHAVMVRLRGLAPAAEEGDALDDLAARRAARRGA